MNIAVRYYTRSGNTEKLAKAVEEATGIQALSVDAALQERADVLFLGCSYYAFDMDNEVKRFVSENKDKIGTIVLFGTSALIKSMRKPMEKLLKELGADIVIDNKEFHCAGSFGVMHRGRPNDNDLEAVKKFVNEYLG